MKKLWNLLSLSSGYYSALTLNLLFNLLAVAFSVFSITLIIPFLDLIFQKSIADYQEILSAGVPHFTWSSSYAKDIFYYYISKWIVTQGPLGKQYALMGICAMIGSGILLKNLFTYFGLYHIAKLRIGIMRDLREKIYEKVTKFPVSYFTQERKGDVLSRMSTDVQELEFTILTSIEMLLRDPLAILLFLACLVSISVKLTLFIIIFLPISGAIIGIVGNMLRKSSQKTQQQMGELTSVFEETISGLRVIQSFTAEKFMKLRFWNINQSYANDLLKMYRKRDLASPLSEFLSAIVMITIVWFGGKMILEKNEISPSEFIGYIILFAMMIPHAKALTTSYFNIQRGNASLDRINQLLNTENPIISTSKAIHFTGLKQHILCNNISFAYQDQMVLSHINLEIQKGEMVAVVGPSGSGKSTLADLMTRFYDVKEGQILLDNIPIEQYDVNSLRNNIGVVSQDTFLFHDTIFNNILFNSSASEQEVLDASKIAHAHDFIGTLENGYQTIVGDRGSKLSGGQKQRISIARAILKNPSILILDEATSALDTESEKIVQKALQNVMKNRTSIVIAHRLSTVVQANKIIVLDQGKIVEHGNHTTLLEKGGLYKKMLDLQKFD